MGNLDPLWAAQFFLFNFTRTLGSEFFLDLRFSLLYITTDVVFAKILVFNSIFGFPAVDLASKRTKTVNFQFVPFGPNFKTLKGFSSNVFVLLGYLWSNLRKMEQYLGK